MRSKRFDELTTTELHDLLRLRCDVFVVEQGCIYPDIDGRDIEPETRHHWIELDGELGAYGRTLREPDGSTRIGRVVTAPRARRRGLAAALVRGLTETLPGEVVLDAQSQLVGWYEQMGYEVAGEPFVEDGIPHVPMRRCAT
jgi:ElaA protein